MVWWKLQEIFNKTLMIFFLLFFISLREPGMGRPPLRAQDFMANNPEHLELLRRMGVSLIHLKDGRVQLVQHATQVLYRPRYKNYTI